MIQLQFYDNFNTYTVRPNDIKVDDVKIIAEFDEQRYTYLAELENLYILQPSARFLDQDTVFFVNVYFLSVNMSWRGVCAVEDRIKIDDDYYKVTIRFDAYDMFYSVLESKIVSVDELSNLAKQIDVAYESDQMTVQRLVSYIFSNFVNTMFTFIQNLINLIQSFSTENWTLQLFSNYDFAILAIPGAGAAASSNALNINIKHAAFSGILSRLKLAKDIAFVTKFSSIIPTVSVAVNFIKTRKKIKFFAVNSYDLLTFVLQQHNVLFEESELSFLKKYHIVTHKKYFKIINLLQLFEAFRKIILFQNVNNNIVMRVVDISNVSYRQKEYVQEVRRDSFDYVAYKKIIFKEQDTNFLDLKENYDFSNNFTYKKSSYVRLVSPAIQKAEFVLNYSLARRKNEETSFDKIIKNFIYVTLFFINIFAAFTVTTFILINLTILSSAIFGLPSLAYFPVRISLAQKIRKATISLALYFLILTTLSITVLLLLRAYTANVKFIQIENLNTNEMITIFEDVNKSYVKENADDEILNDIKESNEQIFIKHIYEETKIPMPVREFLNTLNNIYGIQKLTYYLKDEIADVTSFKIKEIDRNKITIKHMFV